MEKGIGENGDIQKKLSEQMSPIEVLQKLSGEAVRMAGEAWHSAYANSSTNSPILAPTLRHRRTHSEVVAPNYRRSSSSTSNFQKWRSQMQRALRWGSRKDIQYSPFDPEILANQKRQWYQLYSKSLDREKYKEPTSLFEHFVIAGLHADANLEVVEDAFVKRKKLEQEMARGEMLDINMRQYRRPTLPTLEPQVLIKYPPGKRLPLRLKDLAAFCFPGGVTARVLERTPSLSELNELVYGQEHLRRDDLAFVFSLKVADNATLYGICLHVQEVVQKSSFISGISQTHSQLHPRCSRFLVSAPRCYCILTRVPFFELHYEMLNSIIAQERLDRITQFINGMALSDHVPSPFNKSNNHANGNLDSPGGESSTDWMATAIPVDSAMALTAAAAGIISDEEVTSSRWDMDSPWSATSDLSDLSQMRDVDKDCSKDMNVFQDYASETSENQTNDIGKTCKVHDDVQSPASGPNGYRSYQSSECIQSFEALFSSAGSEVSEEEDCEFFYDQDKESKYDLIIEWAMENKNDLLQIICGYHNLSLPERGGKIFFQPLEHLQAIEYLRPSVSSFGLCDKYLEKLKYSNEESQVNLRLAAAEEAVSLSLWSTATICRVLSLENVLALVTSILLEKQVVVVCPNLGVLSAVVLSIIPMIRPFEWQSLFLPILPGKMLDFLDAPVPFVVGIQYKQADLKMKTSGLVQVNVVKDQVKSCNLPLLPHRKKLVSELAPLHSTLSSDENIAHKHPVYKCKEVQAEAAGKFLHVMRWYLDSLCSNLRSHTITSVQSNNDRVSILLKDSFIDSFPTRDQSFIKLFVETQLFTVLSDSCLSSYENGDTKRIPSSMPVKIP